MAAQPGICPFRVQAALKRRIRLSGKMRLQARLFFHAQKPE